MSRPSRHLWALIITTTTLQALPVRAQQTFERTLVSSETLEMLPGVVEAAQQVTLATPFDGLLMQVNVEAGHSIDRDAIVATMDDRVARAAVRVAERSAANVSEIEIAELQLAAARKESERFQEAHRQKAASGMELDRATALAAQAAAQLRKAMEQQAYLASQLDLARQKLEEHQIRSPFEGRVIRVEARPGESLNRAEAVVTVADLRRLRVDLYVPLAWFGRLQVGDIYHLQASSPVNQRISATLVHVEPMIDAATQTFRCRFEIENPSETLPAGFTVRLVSPDAQTTPSNGVATDLLPNHS
jgi:RND family efflux transporter MFP subunit